MSTPAKRSNIVASDDPDDESLALMPSLPQNHTLIDKV
jgi:hypothetical protein